MNDLLRLALDAHGGLERWQQLTKVSANIAVGGALWPIKGWPDVLAKSHTSIDTRRPHTEYEPYLKPEQKAVFEPTQTAIVSLRGETLDVRESPRQSFAGHAISTPWDVQNVIYFAGYAMWTYLTTPFLFTLPRFEIEETAPWSEDGQTWRGLKVTFPPEVPSHSTEQTFYFDASGLLRRHDYSVEIMGGTSSANYATEHKSFGGIVFPTKRRVYSKGEDGRPMLNRVAVAIDFADIQVS
jgi:hypothetical protein